MILRITTKNENVAQTRHLVSGFSSRIHAKAAESRSDSALQKPYFQRSPLFIPKSVLICVPFFSLKSNDPI